MKRLVALLILTSVFITGCGPRSVTVDPSYFTGAYAKMRTASGSYIQDNSFEGLPDSLDFLYQDLCFSSSELIPEASFDFSAVSAFAFDVTDASILYSKGIFEKVYPASTTKLLTALVAAKHSDPDELVLIKEDNCGITTPGAQLTGFKAGDTVLMKDLLTCLLIYSGNDAAVAIAEHVSGSVNEFCKLMNKEAALIGATGTHFTNPHGLQDNNHYTTAYDIYLIFNECLKMPLIYDILTASSAEVVIDRADGESFIIPVEPTNYYFKGLAEAPEGISVICGKTGETVAARNCLVIYSLRSDGHCFITGLFRSADRKTVYNEMNELLKICVGK